AGAKLESILGEEVVVDGAAVVVLGDAVEEGVAGDTEQEIGKIVAGEESGGEVEGAVVVGTIETQWRDGLNVTNVQAELHGVAAFGLAHGVRVFVDIRFVDAAKAIHVESLDRVEVNFGDAVEKEIVVPDGVDAETLSEACAVEGIGGAVVVAGEAEAE